MIALEPHKEGVVLPVKALPGARHSALRGTQDGALRVAVTQVAEKGKANRAILQLLCKQLQLRRSQLQLLSGDAQSQKRYLVTGTTAEELAAVIERALQG